MGKAWLEAALEALEGLYPKRLAEGWDNVGLLVDSLDSEEELGPVGPILLTNDLTDKVLDEAIHVHGAKLIVTYHPRPFGKFNKCESETEACGAHGSWDLVIGGSAGAPCPFLAELSPPLEPSFCSWDQADAARHDAAHR
jgi:hypothetical protein